MTDNTDLLSRITHQLRAHAPGENASFALLVLAVGLHLVVDVPVTLRASSLESNPLVLALGFEAWVVVKTVLSAGLVGAWVVGREHWSVGYVAGFGVVSALPATANLLVVHGGPTGGIALVLVAGVLVSTLGAYFNRELQAVRVRRPGRRTVHAVVFSAILVVSVVAPWVGFIGVSSQNASAVESDVLWHGDGDSSTIQAYQSDGSQDWTSGDNPHSLASTQESVFSSQTGVKKLNRSDGSIEWSYSHGTTTTNQLDVNSSGYIYVGDRNGDLVLVDPEGNKVWEKNFSTGNPFGVTGVSVDSKDNVYIGHENNAIEKLSPDGSVIWTTSLSETPYKIDWESNDVFVGTMSGTVLKIGSDGNEVWSKASGLSDSNDIKVYDNKIITTGDDGSEVVYLTDEGGSAKKEFTTDPIGTAGYGWSVAFDKSGEFYVGTQSGLLAKYDTNGNQIWNISNPGVVEAISTPAEIIGKSKSDVSGQAISQTGSPISNATVVGYTSSKPSVSQARSQLDTLSNPLPETFRDQRDSGFKLLGSNGAWTDASGNYVGVYSTSDINADPWVDSADLSEPMWQSVPVNQEVALVVGDPTKNSIIQGTNEYNRQIPGQTVEDTVVVERLAPDGSVVSSQKVETSERSGEGLLDPSTMPYATYTFDEGVYRISAEDSSFSYLIMAGSPTAIIDQYVNDINASLTDYSRNVADALNAGGLSRVTTTTNANGEFAFDVPDGTQVVHVQAYKSSTLTDVQNVDPQNVTLGDIRDEYAIDRSASEEQIQEQLESLPEGSIYLPSRAYRVEPPNQNVTVRMVEVTMPPLGDLEALQSRQQQLLDELNNGSFQDLLGDRLEDINEEELRDVYGRLDRLRERNERIDSRYRELLENSTYEDIEIDVNETGNAELRTRIRNLQESVRRLQDTIDSEPPEIETGSESINARFRFDEALERDDVTVLAHWSNGTTTTVADEYVDLDGSLGNTAGVGSTSVRLSDFPLGESDPNSVEFEVLVANEDGTGTSRVPVKNPTFSGNLPTLDSVAVTSLEPGPSDAVEVTLTPSEDSSFRSVTGATVYGPSGSTVATVDAANITDGNTFEFSTNGQGRYWVEAQVESADGAQFTLPFSLNAANTDKPRQPGIRAKSGPLGTYAVVGDGFDAGAIRTTAQGDVEVIGQLNQDQDVPDRVQVYLSALDDSRDSEVTVRLTRGENRESINEHVYVTLHGKSLTEDALVYRMGDQPLTRDASTRFGRVGTGGNGTVIETYTQADGSVSVRTINNPDRIDRIRHYVRTFTADLDVPFTTLAPALPSPETSSTTVATISPATVVADTPTVVEPGTAHGAVAATEAVI